MSLKANGKRNYSF